MGFAGPAYRQRIVRYGVFQQAVGEVLRIKDTEGITFVDLAKRCNMSVTALSALLNGTRPLTIKSMVRIADAVGLELAVTAKPKRE